MTMTLRPIDGRRVQPDLAVDEIHVLIVVELQIDDAVGAEAGHADVPSSRRARSGGSRA